MSWFKSKVEQLRENLYDEHIHAQVAAEICKNHIWPGLWAKAFAQAQGNDTRAKGIYINLRVEQIKLGAEVQTQLVEQIAQALQVVNNQRPVSITASRTTPTTPAATPAKPNFEILSHAAQRAAILDLHVYCRICSSNNLRAGTAATDQGHFCVNCGAHRINADFRLA